jgi:hypothetical protein
LCDFEEEFAGERVAVGVETCRGQPQQYIAGLNFFSGDQFFPRNGADDGAGQVVLAVGIEAGHLRGFAADERAAVLAAGCGDAGNHFLDHLGRKTPGGEVVEKKQGRRALHGNVVDAVVDQVRADGVVDAQLESQLELGADAVGARNQHRIGKALEIEHKQAAEAAYAAQHSFGRRGFCERLDALLGAFAGGDIDACSGVGVGLCR